MKIEDLKNKMVAVLGYGQEGKATAAYLLKHGIKPVLFDQKPWEMWAAEEQSAIKSLGINFIFGPDAFLELKGFDVGFRSPGIPITKLEKSGLKIITSQTKWFFEHCPAKIIGITGTKGKGTTTALIYEITKADIASKKNIYPRVFLTGNIGQEQPLDLLDALQAEDWVCYELSSFQLQDLSASPHIAVVLMVTSEHLDYHRDLKEYHGAKSSIAKFQTENDFTIINKDFPPSQVIGAFGKGKKIFYSTSQALTAGCYLKDGAIYVNGVWPKKTEIIKIADIKLRGKHNLENVCAAVLAAACAGSGLAAIRKILKAFKGLEHRLEFVSEKNGIKFFNDSFSTTPETAIAAITSFSEPLIVILGGSSKNSDFSGLGKTILSAKNLKAVILIGEEAGKIKKALDFAGKILESAKNMPEIFEQIKSVAAPGDVVLLSPACASFDMFKDYKDRGRQFKQQAQLWR